MKVLLLNGSPRQKGCTYTALCEVEKALHAEGVETVWYQIGNKPVQPCIGCGACRTKGGCALNDDVNALAEIYAQCDGIVVGSPVYYASANGGLCAFLDRLYYSQSAKFAYKPAAAVVSCRRGGASASFDRLNKYFTINNQPVVPSQYWNAVHGACPEDVLEDAEGLQIMRTLGRNMAWLLKCIDAGKQAGIDTPAPEAQRQRTNFIR